MHNHPRSLFAIFAAAAFASSRQVFGGIPLQRLSNKSRRKYKRQYAGNHSTTSFKHDGARQRARALAFKERHGHFATETSPLWS